MRVCLRSLPRRVRVHRMWIAHEHEICIRFQWRMLNAEDRIVVFIRSSPFAILHSGRVSAAVRFTVATLMVFEPACVVPLKGTRIGDGQDFVLAEESAESDLRAGDTRSRNRQ